MLTATWSFAGYDSAAHLIEETMAADTTAGYPMLYAIVLSFAVGLVYLLTLTICIQVIICNSRHCPIIRKVVYLLPCHAPF